MEFKNFVLHKDDGESYVIGHPNGKTLTINKKGLSDKAHEVISKLKKYADGGSVASDAINNFVSPPTSSAADVPVQAPEASTATPASVSAGEVPIGGGATGSFESPSQQGPGLPSPSQAEQDPLIAQKIGTEDVLGQQEKNVQEFAKAAGAAAGAKQAALSDYNKMEQGRQTPEQIVAGYKDKDDQLAQAFMDQKLDPNRYWANQSIGSKITGAIGMILSGFGSGLSHQPNLALNIINQGIQNDIEAQKNEQGKQKTLWEMNQHALGNDLAAHSATENQLWTAVQAKIAQASAGVEGAQAKFNAANMINQIEQQKVQNRLRLGLLTQGMEPGGGGLSRADPAQLVNELVTDPAQKAKALDEIGKAQHVAQNQGKMLDLFDQAAKENTVLRTGAGLVRTPASILGLRGLAQPLIKDEAGRPSEIQQKIFNDLLPAPGDTDAKIAEKRANFVSYLNNQKEAPNAKANGIDLNRFASTNTNTFQAQPKNQQYMAWAQANPNNPLAQKYLKANGG